jgi:hypothetical protein
MRPNVRIRPLCHLAMEEALENGIKIGLQISFFVIWVLANYEIWSWTFFF